VVNGGEEKIDVLEHAIGCEGRREFIRKDAPLECVYMWDIYAFCEDTSTKPHERSLIAFDWTVQTHQKVAFFREER
jgi:hypothetical protein